MVSQADGHQEIQVAGHGNWINKFFGGLALLVIFSGVIIPKEERAVGIAVIVFGAMVLLGALLIAYFRFLRRAWICDIENGFTYRDRLRNLTTRDDEVTSVQVKLKNNYTQGVLKSVTRAVTIRVTTDDQPLKLRHTAKLNKTDPLGPLLVRMIENYRARASEAIDAGASLGARGWSLGRDELTLTHRSEDHVKINEITAIDLIDGRYNVWKAGVDSPVLSISEFSDNAFLLDLLLRPRIAELQKDRKFDVHEPGLGRLLFERGSSPAVRLTGRVLIWGGILAMPIGFALTPNIQFVNISIFLMFVAPMAIPLGFFLKRNEFRCHERGVYRKSMFSTRELRFEDVETFSYTATRMYDNGFYAGTNLKLSFEPQVGLGKRRVAYSRSVQNADEAIDSFRDHVSRIVLVRMWRIYQETGSVYWMPNVRISKDGFRFRAQGFMGRKKEQLLPFNEVAGFNIQAGVVHVWKHGVTKSVIHESVSEPNCFPGLMLVQSMYEQP